MSVPAPSFEPSDHVLLVTGKLAEASVRDQCDQLNKQTTSKWSIHVMPITVAALMTPKWLARKLEVPGDVTHVVVPGYCEQGVDVLAQSLRERGSQALICCGPKDCRDLRSWATGKQTKVELNDHNIEIIAEINHAPRQSIDDVIRIADRLVSDGADRIDVGADPTNSNASIERYVAALVARDFTVSIDTFDANEARRAIDAGATLWLSVNRSNRDAAIGIPCEVVAIPDTPSDLNSLDDTVAFLEAESIAMRLDPILEPIGSGLMASLMRYQQTRSKYPDHAMMMGIGNLTELTDVDSAGINVMLLGICAELGIESVLTTQVINWARSSVKECEIARRLVHHSVSNGVPPKRLSDDLVMLRDPKLRPHTTQSVEALASGIKDNNYRILTRDDQIEILSAGIHLRGEDPFLMLEQLLQQPQSDNVDASHAFYLGYEMAKASIALQLGKQYEQDQALNWGHLTVPEDLHRIKRTSRHRRQSSS
ncbi:MAG: DUF6513 domain-containing protein [Planctomycetota bacterium]